MSTNIARNPFLDMLADGASQKVKGRKDPFSNNPALTDNEFFNPLEDKNFREVLSQTGKSMHPTLKPTHARMSLSDVLNNVKTEILNISDQSKFLWDAKATT